MRRRRAAGDARKHHRFVLPHSMAHSLLAALVKVKLYGIAVVDDVVDGFFRDFRPAKPLLQVPALRQATRAKRATVAAAGNAC